MKFRPRLWSSFFTLLGLALLLSLGSWQTQRYLSKKAFEDARDASIARPPVQVVAPETIQQGDVDFRQIEVPGQWRRDYLFLIKHRIFEGQPGFWILAAFVPYDAPNEVLFVNVGWIPVDNAHDFAEEFLASLPHETIVLSGLVHPLEYVVPDRELRLSAAESLPPPGIIDIASYDPQVAADILQVDSYERPLVLTLGENLSDQRYPIASFDHITEPYLTSQTHFGYALTWFTLALALLAIWVAHGLGLLHARSFDTPTPRP